MVGLSFPDAREASASVDDQTVTDDELLIDPALIDPALYGEQSQPHTVEQTQTDTLAPPPPKHDSFSPGPQGDPFAPQPLDFYPAPPPQHVVQDGGQKRKKKTRKRKRREDWCGFCLQKERNKRGAEERLISCAECLRSTHPTCAEIDHILDNVISYDWRCNDCKDCEVCGQDPEGVDMTLCESCDRGWHMHCLTPPRAHPPSSESDWFCPKCTNSPQGVEQPSQRKPRPTTTLNQLGPDGELILRPEGLNGVEEVKDEDEGGGARVVGDGTPDIPDYAPEPTEPIKKPRIRQRTYKTRPDTTPATPGPSSLKRRRKTMEQPRKRRKVVEDDEEEDGEEEEEDSEEEEGEKRKTRLVLKLPTAKGKERARDDTPEHDEHADVLSIPDRDVLRTTIKPKDKSEFEKARLSVEAKGLPPAKPLSGVGGGGGGGGRNTRSAHLAALAPSNPALEPGRSQSPPVPPTPSASAVAGPSQPRIKTIRLGVYDIQTWYDAPFPEEYAQIPDGRLWLCEFCLRHVKSEFTAARHRLKCKARHPPGLEVYRDGALSIYEVDGRQHKLYCQNLCLLSKMFLDHKSLFYDVEPFLFYVLTEQDVHGAQFVGYFSKEKRSPNEWNLSCIMCLPVRQRRGFGGALIEFSYLLSQKERRLGSPEKPLSALGAIGYRNYWTLAIMRYLDSAPAKPRLEDIARATSMTVEDIYNTLDRLGFIRVPTTTPDTPARPRLLPGQSMRYPPAPRRRATGMRRVQTTSALGATPPPIPVPSTSSGTAAAIQTNSSTAAHGALAPASGTGHHGSQTPPFVPPRRYTIVWDPAVVRAHLEKWDAKGYMRIYPSKLRWTPFITTRTGVKSETPRALDGKAVIEGLVWYPKDPTPEPEPEVEVVEVVEERPRIRTRRSTKQDQNDAGPAEGEAGPSSAVRVSTPRPRRRVSSRQDAQAEAEAAAEEVTPRPRRRASTRATDDAESTPAKSPEVPAVRRLRSTAAHNDELPALFPLPVTISRPRIRNRKTSEGNSVRSSASVSPNKSSRTRQSQAQAAESEPAEPELEPALRRKPSRRALEAQEQAETKEREKLEKLQRERERAIQDARRRKKAIPRFDDDLPLPAPVKATVEAEPSEPPTPRKPRNRRKAPAVEESEATPRATRRSSRRGAEEEPVAEPEPKADSLPPPPSTPTYLVQPRKKDGRFAKPIQTPSEDGAPTPTPPRSRSRKPQTRRRNTAPTSSRRRSRRSRADDDEEFEYNEDPASDEDEDEDDSVLASPRKPRSRARGSRSRRDASESDFQSESEEDFIVDDDEEVETRPVSRRKSSSRRPRNGIADSSDVEVVAAPPLSRRGSSNRGLARKRQRIESSEPESEVPAKVDGEEAKEDEEDEELERVLLGDVEEAMEVDKAQDDVKEKEGGRATPGAEGIADAGGKASINGSTDANADGDADADGEPDAEGETDDARPPENGRHSAPSDDTVFVADAAASLGKPSPIAFTPEAARASPSSVPEPAPGLTPKVTRLSTPLERVPTSRPVSRPISDHELSDADAEGSTDDEFGQ